MTPAENIIFAGFSTVTPALVRVLASLGARARSAQWNLPPLRPSPGKSFPDLPAEIEFAARWARAQWEDHTSRSIGVFVPDLSSHRSAVERTFRQVCYPGAFRALLNPADPRQPRESVFHINAPSDLQHEPLIAGALLLLEIARPRIPIADAGSILRSPWLRSSFSERSVRALADIELRRRRELDVTLNDLERASASCPVLSRTWDSVRRSLRRNPASDTFSGWTRFIGDLLGSLGWPGDDELTAHEQDLLEAWKDAVSELAALSLVSGLVTLDQALIQLKVLLAGHWDQTGASAPIHILDASQAAGFEFDSAFALGLSEETWPPAQSFTSPLIPLQLQRERGLPGSSPTSLFKERSQLTAALFAAAPSSFCSWSGRLSPPAARFVAPVPKMGHWRGNLPGESFKPAILEGKEDADAPPFQAVGVIRGGTGIIRAQSLCPFRAFAEYRLGGSSPEEGCLGLDARDRGGHLHRALEFVWQKLQTRDRLRSVSPAARETLVKEAILEAVKDDRSSPFHEVVTAVERERLQEVILGWLDIESSRVEPFVVEITEQERHCELSGLPLRLRVDRMDRLPDGSLVLIDYKSGPQTRNKLKGERPSEPQLLVYASAVGAQVDGLLFAELKPRDQRPVGVTRSKQFDSRSVDVIGKKWEAFLAESEANVTRLASEFRQGAAAVDPLPGACSYCAQKPLCRVNELGGGEEAEE